MTKMHEKAFESIFRTIKLLNNRGDWGKSGQISVFGP